MKIRTLLKTSKRWCKFRLGIDKDGIECIGNDECAVQWCLIGAVQKCYGPRYMEKAVGAQLALHKAILAVFPEYRSMGGLSDVIVQFNNAKDTDFAKVRKVLLKANV